MSFEVTVTHEAGCTRVVVLGEARLGLLAADAAQRLRRPVSVQAA